MRIDTLLDRFAKWIELPAADAGVSGEPLLALFNKLTMVRGEKDCLAVQIVGARSGAGSSTIARNLARFAAASLSAPVLLIDADPRGSDREAAPPIESRLSLQEALDRPEGLEAALRPTGIANLSVARMTVHVADERSESDWVMPIPAVAEIMSQLRSRFQWIVVDSVTPHEFAFSYVLSRFMDGTVIVVEAEKTRTPVAQELIHQVRTNGGNPLGVVINKRRLLVPDILYRRL